MKTTFNKDQLSFIAKQCEIWDSGDFDEILFEDDMWYVFNQSGLFEDHHWTVSDTRKYITERKK
jgi:hypothetical protein